MPYKELLKLARYGLVGALAYATEMGVFLLIITFFADFPVLANIIGKIVAALLALPAHQRFTFEVAKNDRNRTQTIKYFTLLAVNLPISSIILSISLLIIPFVTLAKFIADIICIAITYWISSRYVFTHSNNEENITSENSKKSIS